MNSSIYNFSRAKLSNPAGERNKGPILEVLHKTIPSESKNLQLLEISSGTGLHTSYFAKYFPNITFQPSEYDQSLFASINAHIQESGMCNILHPIKIDISKNYKEWYDGELPYYDLMLNFNMMHISPFSCSEGLFRNAGSLLKGNGLLITYGPYCIDGVLVPESNVNFDAMLRSRDPSWGVRDLRDLEKLANTFGINLEKIYDMPSNNKCVIWKKSE